MNPAAHTLRRSDLDQLAASNHGKALVFDSKCCKRNDAIVIYNPNQGTLTLLCAKCSKRITQIALEPSISVN